MLINLSFVTVFALGVFRGHKQSLGQLCSSTLTINTNDGNVIVHHLNPVCLMFRIQRSFGHRVHRLGFKNV